MSPVASGYWLSGALPVVAVVAISGVVSLAIAAWLIRGVAHSALERSAQDDVPQVLAALGGLLDRLRLFLPWPGRGHEFLPTGVPSDRAASHTDSVKDLPEGGPQ
jgi:hypothetical protein